ncbi:MAG: hypothetical protein QG657_2695 [Acidobacteriota bacterium]|nr:hypothetical protein [Acidobacteriota bacterium]
MNAVAEGIIEKGIVRRKREVEVPNVKTADAIGKISTQGGLWFQYTKSARMGFGFGRICCQTRENIFTIQQTLNVYGERF